MLDRYTERVEALARVLSGRSKIEDEPLAEPTITYHNIIRAGGFGSVTAAAAAAYLGIPLPPDSLMQRRLVEIANDIQALMMYQAIHPANPSPVGVGSD